MEKEGEELGKGIKDVENKVENLVIVERIDGELREKKIKKLNAGNIKSNKE